MNPSLVQKIESRHNPAFKALRALAHRVVQRDR